MEEIAAMTRVKVRDPVTLIRQNHRVVAVVTRAEIIATVPVPMQELSRYAYHYPFA